MIPAIQVLRATGKFLLREADRATVPLDFGRTHASGMAEVTALVSQNHANAASTVSEFIVRLTAYA